MMTLLDKRKEWKMTRYVVTMDTVEKKVEILDKTTNDKVTIHSVEEVEPVWIRGEGEDPDVFNVTLRFGDAAVSIEPLREAT